MSPATTRLALFLVVAAVTALGVVVFAPAAGKPPEGHGPDVAPAAPRTGAVPRDAPAGAGRRAPEREAVASYEEAYAVEYPMVDIGLGPRFPGATHETALTWPDVFRAIEAVPGLLVRWENDEVKRKLLAESLELSPEA